MTNWMTVTAGARGTAHVENGLPCQDYALVQVTNEGVVLGAVADGAGSAPHSARGAHLAASTAVRFMRSKSRQVWNTLSAAEARSAWIKTVQGVRTRLEDHARLKGYGLSDLACTLIAFVATPERMLAMQIGDGFIVTRGAGREEFRLLFDPAHGEYANETTFVTCGDATKVVQTGIWDERPQFICASTDGLERLGLDLVRGGPEPHTAFFRCFEQFLAGRPGRAEAKRELGAFLDSERVNARVTDDKTLLLALNQMETCGEGSS